MKSTRDIVQGQGGRPEPFEGEMLANVETVDPSAKQTEYHKSGNKRLWLVIGLGVITLLLIAALALYFLRPASSKPQPTEPTQQPTAATEAPTEAPTEIPSLDSDLCLLPIPTADMTGSINTGDLVAICSRDGMIPALQYVEVKNVGQGGTVTVVVTQDQLAQYLQTEGEITVVVRALADDPQRTVLLAWQAHYNDPTVTLRARQNAVTIDVGQPVELPVSCTIEPSEVPVVYSYEVSDPEIVSVEDGQLIGLAVGETDITVTCYDKQAKFHVTAVVLPKEIKLNHTGYWLAQGTTKQFRVSEYIPANTTDQSVTWSSADTAIATVADDGTVAAVQLGRTTITAKCGNVSAECVIVVYAPATSLELSKESLKVKVGAAKQLTATALPEAEHRKIYWKSSDESIATVAADGTITGIAPGEATITATADGLTAACTITVK